MDSGEKPKKRVTERYLRYAATVQILPKTGHLRIRNERLSALKKNGQEKARNPFIEKVCVRTFQKLKVNCLSRA